VSNNGAFAVVALLVFGVLLWFILSSSATAAPVASATLTQRNASGVTGTASFVPASDGQSTSVVVRLRGLTPDDAYAVTINDGSCLGPRLFILSPVSALASGQGSSATTIPALPQSYWYVAVHANASPAAALVACGVVQIASGQSYRVPVQNQPFQLPNGGGGPPKTPIPTPGR
jgi:hypothetical protein